MKRIFGLLEVLVSMVLVLFLSNDATAQNTPQNSSPSLQETQDWLKEKLSYYASFTEVIAGRDTIQKVDLVSFNGCTLTYRYIRKSPSIGLEIAQKFTFSLGDIDPSKTKIDGKEGRYLLVLTPLESKPKIKMETNAALMGPVKDESKWVSSTQFPFDSLEMADRVSKAFTHAVGLCKGREELFSSNIKTPDAAPSHKQDQQQAIKREEIRMPITVLSFDLYDSARPKFQSTNVGWCFIKLQNNDPARTIILIEAIVEVQDTMRGFTADRLRLKLEGKIKPLKVGEGSTSLGVYYLPTKWNAKYLIERIRFEDGSEWKRF